MQNVIHYIRLVETGGYRFIGTSGFQRTMQGLDSFSEKVLVRGDFKKLDALFLPGTAHPNTATFPDFYVNGISGGQIIPANNETMCVASVEYQGIMNVAKRPVMEEFGAYVNSKYFAGAGGPPPSSVTMTGIPGRPDGVYNIDVQQLVPSYRRSYVSKTEPAYPTVNTSTGVMNAPANFVPPAIPENLTWLVDAYATCSYPNGWALVNRSTQQTRLAGVNGRNGALVPLFSISEEWHFRPLRSSL